MLVINMGDIVRAKGFVRLSLFASASFLRISSMVFFEGLPAGLPAKKIALLVVN